MLPTGLSCRLCVNEGSLSGVIRHRPLGAGAQRLRHKNRKVSSGPNTRATAQPALGWQQQHTHTHTHTHTHLGPFPAEQASLLLGSQRNCQTQRNCLFCPAAATSLTNKHNEKTYAISSVYSPTDRELNMLSVLTPSPVFTH